MDTVKHTPKMKRIVVICLTAAVLCIAVYLLAIHVLIPAKNYSRAISFMEAGQYEQAAAAFEAMHGYKDSEQKASECQNEIIRLDNEQRYGHALALKSAGNYEEAIAAFASLTGYKDSDLQLQDTRYLQAGALAAGGDYSAACEVYDIIRGYKDAADLLARAEQAMTRDTEFTVGSYAVFGRYEQDGNSENGAEPIEWLVLDRNGSRALLLSRYILDAKTYNSQESAVTWKNCSLRAWLNDSFLKTAFTPEEQAAVVTTEVDNSRNQCYPGYPTDGGDNTQDKVFLLSFSEANQYLNVNPPEKPGAEDNMRARAWPTAYAIAQGASTFSRDVKAEDVSSQWLLRSPGSIQLIASYVAGDGSFHGAYIIARDSGGIRPALWLDLNDLSF